MTTYVMRDGKLVEKSKAPPKDGVFIITDGMSTLEHPVTGKVTDSKSHFRRMTRDTGCVEVGTEPIRERQFVKRGEAPQQTIKRLFNL